MDLESQGNEVCFYAIYFCNFYILLSLTMNFVCFASKKQQK